MLTNMHDAVVGLVELVGAGVDFVHRALGAAEPNLASVGDDFSLWTSLYGVGPVWLNYADE